MCSGALLDLLAQPLIKDEGEAQEENSPSVFIPAVTRGRRKVAADVDPAGRAKRLPTIQTHDITRCALSLRNSRITIFETQTG